LALALKFGSFLDKIWPLGKSRSGNPGCRPTVLSAMLANNVITPTCFAIFQLIKFMCFGSTLVTHTRDFSTRTRPAPNLTPAYPARTYPHSSVRSCTWPANVGTRNPPGLTRPAQDSILQSGRLKLYGEIK